METVRVPPSPALRAWSRQHGFSPELVARWGAFYGDLQQLVAAMGKPSATFLRPNPLRGHPEDTLAQLLAKGFVLAPSGVPGTWRVDEAPFSPGATEEYLVGRYWLQDASSALAPMALDPQPGETVADLCAAPGGKTLGIASLMHDQGAIVSYESDPKRAKALESNLARCGVRSAAVYTQRAQEAARLGVTFDRVLLDAPCTGEGVIQRDPGRRQGHLGEYAQCAKEQADLLRVAHQILRPGGTLVYSTCTLAPEENELQVHDLVEAGLFEVESLPASMTDLRIGGHPLRPGLQVVAEHNLHPSVSKTAHVLPHPHGVLGFYVARLRRTEAA